MHLYMLLLLYSHLLGHVAARATVRHSTISDFLPRRTYSEHFRLADSVRNCSDASWSLEPLAASASILLEDCQHVLSNLRYNHGYYEVWQFDTNHYEPLTGFQSCVFAVAKRNDTNPDDYAIIGNDDVVSVVVEALGTARFHTNTTVAGVVGLFNCGPRKVPLSLIVYNGLTGYSDSRNYAPPVDLWGDVVYTSTATVPAPTTSNIPTESPEPTM
ncbi:hypothetical protein BD289DRAFT_485495 [Coniella lustricola]|uniref:Ecp2 effector protein-like domain-containing protein n=1 Tax=Coniella lustricola TaxID=2025994 RepID=A0A2T2ZYD3_9PEZI|nr:hypothetical protein BD289DRAFT_485495 [Coniella lustricola]